MASEKCRLTERDHEILRALSLYVRYFSQSQVRKHWFENDAANARRRLNKLQAAGLVERIQTRSRSLPPLTTPLISWRPGSARPSFTRAAYHCRSRWKLRHVQSCFIYLATTAASQLYGGRMSGEIRKELQVTHDLGVSQVWLYFDLHHPEWADAWKGEDLMAHTRRGQKLPDGFIVDPHGKTLCVIEFGGSYDEERIREFHLDCEGRQLPYQLW